MDNQDFTPNELKGEQWRDIPGYKGLYQVSNLGRVKSLRRERRNQYGGFMKDELILTPRKSGKGYIMASLYVRGKSRNRPVHRLVLSAFVRMPFADEQCNHIDGNKGNNRLKNLEWVSQSENMQHAVKLGLIQRPAGEEHTKAKLTNAQVNKARAEYRRGVRGYGAHVLAKKYGVSKQAMRKILSGETYRDI